MTNDQNGVDKLIFYQHQHNIDIIEQQFNTVYIHNLYDLTHQLRIYSLSFKDSQQNKNNQLTIQPQKHKKEMPENQNSQKIQQQLHIDKIIQIPLSQQFKKISQIKQEIPQMNQEDDFAFINYFIVIIILVLIIAFFMKSKIYPCKKQSNFKNNFELIQYHQEQHPDFTHFDDNQ